MQCHPGRISAITARGRLSDRPCRTRAKAGQTGNGQLQAAFRLLGEAKPFANCQALACQRPEACTAEDAARQEAGIQSRPTRSWAGESWTETIRCNRQMAGWLYCPRSKVDAPFCLLLVEWPNWASSV